jgi:hypothetical protein
MSFAGLEFLPHSTGTGSTCLVRALMAFNIMFRAAQVAFVFSVLISRDKNPV